jgi:hypothetical protein
MANFDLVEDAVQDAKAIAWDTCHKIYVLMDDEQVALMRTYEYDPLITSDEMTPTQMLETIKKWFDESCGLRFVSSVATNPKDPNEGFVNLIGQFEDEECEDCGESGCAGVCNDDEDEEE